MEPDRPEPSSGSARWYEGALRAADFLLRSPGAVGSSTAADRGWSAAGPWFILWGVLIGVTYCLIYRLAWRVFGEYQGIRWGPAIAVLSVDLALLGHGLLVGFVQAVGGNDRSEASSVSLAVRAALTVVLVALAKFALLVSVPLGTWQNPTTGWDWQAVLGRLGPLYPRPLYRPLVLMPMWGRWAMALAASIGRIHPQADPRIHRLGGGTRVTVLFGQWMLGAGLTILYCSGSGEHLARGVLTALAVLVVAYLAGFLFARLHHGQNEATLRAVGLVAELTFLAMYVAGASAIYWY